MTRTRTPSQYYDEALNTVMLSVQPLLNQINRSRTQTVSDYRNRMATSKNVYKALGNQLSDVGAQFNTNTAGLAPQLVSDIGGLSNLLGSSVGAPAAGEEAAGRNMMTSIGSGALSTLSNNMARNAAFTASTERQGAIENLTNRRNLTSDLQTTLNDLHSRGIDVMESVPAQVQAEMRNLQTDAFNKRMALAQLALSRRSLADQEKAARDAQIAADKANAYTHHVLKAILDYYNQPPPTDWTNAPAYASPSISGSPGGNQPQPFAGTTTGTTGPPVTDPGVGALSGLIGFSGTGDALPVRDWGSVGNAQFQNTFNNLNRNYNMSPGDALASDWNFASNSYIRFSNWLDDLLHGRF